MYTASERYLRQLADHSFLKLWGYSNTYRAPGKELCDLLIVFGNDIILFSDKYCEFKPSDSPTTSWARWFRKAVDESARQLWGAEKRMRANPKAVFLDEQAKVPFPLELHDIKDARFHLVAVAHGISKHCRTALGGSGSLMLTNTLKGLHQHVTPFMIGDLDPSRTFVHVLDDLTLEVVLRNRDTVSDFTLYLRKKEEFFRSGKIVSVTGEEEYLAVYLTTVNPQGEHECVVPSDVAVFGIEEGHWQAFEAHPRRVAQRAANTVSYMWDEFIEISTGHILNKTQQYSNMPTLAENERGLRWFAAMPRHLRRVLAESLLDILSITPRDRRTTAVHLPFRPGDPYFVLMVFPVNAAFSEERNRTVRRHFLQTYCALVKVKYPEALDIVGFATEAGRLEGGDGSEDYCFLDAREWTDRANDAAKHDIETLALGQSERWVDNSWSEYPSVPAEHAPSEALGRNDPCPCGSGKKFKKCHG